MKSQGISNSTCTCTCTCGFTIIVLSPKTEHIKRGIFSSTMCTGVQEHGSGIPSTEESSLTDDHTSDNTKLPED